MGLSAYLNGILGENKACAFLKKNDFEIITRNFHSKYGEIDIIAKKNEILHFIEVKFTKKDYEVWQRVDKSKYDKILKTIDYYMIKHNFNKEFQLDLICIKNDKIEFYENISF
ncbi:MULTISPECIES: YraN family protein [unclassified Campylobacter]|uniref:YraN family protein n=1 Tax=unclassified Campylobacter TaxID=2593542 RepID=UPI001237C124|nr:MULTISPECIES: YraN family protein [unclassified Campylobacter]KAA6225213.1 YraN family protein [Campylobacter sp. LR196d]KAA6226224.1 YraN family protein [Campylobacter sp. LR185c]KAA6228975.1 YraN family protein [Campylobacter sp. LR286c]KAA6231426.1 YraN family protein [Campylobacter sp. LR264d]KAA6231638.1 YraN family protein [Campylobacter sp. LR291e]